MAVRLLTSLFAALLMTVSLVGGAIPSVVRGWESGLDVHTRYGRPVVGDTVDTTATEPGHAYEAGAILYTRADDVSLRVRPSATARPLALVRATHPLVYLGKSKNGFLWVQFPGGIGWVRVGHVAARLPVG